MRACAVRAGKQASLIAGPAYKTALDLSVAAVTGHQLRFHFGRLAGRLQARACRPASGSPAPLRPVRLRSRWVQLLLFDVPRDLSRVSAQLPPLDAGLAERLHAEAERLAELRGWSPRTLSLTQRGLRILPAVHGPGEPVRASTVRQLTARNMPFPHIIDVLAAAGMLDDDRPDSLAVWLDEQLAGLPAQIRAELDTWLGLRRHGGPRRRPRSRRTIVGNIHSIRTFLTDAGEPVLHVAAGHPRRHHDVAGQPARPVAAPGRQHAAQPVRHPESRAADLRQPRPRRPRQQAQPVSSRPAARAPAHRGCRRGQRTIPRCGSRSRWPACTRCCPARSGTCALDQVDLPGLRLDPGGLDRPLDEFTAAAIPGYLDFRTPAVALHRQPVPAGHPQNRPHRRACQPVLDEPAVPPPARHR